MGWISGAIALVGTFASGMAEKEQADQDRKDRLAMNETEAKWSRLNSQFDAEQDYYYKQLERANTQRGLDQFRAKSTVKQFDPSHVDPNNRIVVPNRPVYNQGIYAPTPEPAQGGDRQSFFERHLDPAGLFT